jgi:hypothetical protein
MNLDIRIYDVLYTREYREFQPSQTLSTAFSGDAYGHTFYAEPIPLDEINMTDQDRFILVVSFERTWTRVHGPVQKFVVKPVITFFLILQRLNYSSIQESD